MFQQSPDIPSSLENTVKWEKNKATRDATNDKHAKIHACNYTKHRQVLVILCYADGCAVIPELCNWYSSFIQWLSFHEMFT